MDVSVIIPAFNEERFLPATMNCLQQAIRYMADRLDRDIEIIVADNASTDQTAGIAAEFGAKVVSVSEHNIAHVRNAGAAAASGKLLVFLDADTLVPETVLARIVQVTDDSSCLGGAVDTHYQPRKTIVRLYLHAWRILGRLLAMAQGATQFCHRDSFVALGGYDESLYMGEDVDFYWRLRRLARSENREVCFMKDIQVVPSCRRFDQWPFWRTLVETNPVLILFRQKKKAAWNSWYRDIPR